MDEEHHGAWNKSGSSGYDSQPHSDHSSLEKNSPPATKCVRNGARPPSSPSEGSSGGSQSASAAPWLSPIEEGVVDARQYCIPRPVWPGRDGAPFGYAADPERIPRARCCRHCTRCRCRSDSGAGGYSGYGSAYSGSAGGTVSTSTTSGGRGTGGTGSCADDVNAPSSGTASVKSNDSPLTLDARCDVGKALANKWNSVDLRLNQKTDNLHYVSTCHIYIHIHRVYRQWSEWGTWRQGHI